MGYTYIIFGIIFTIIFVIIVGIIIYFSLNYTNYANNLENMTMLNGLNKLNYVKTPKIIWTYWENMNGETEYPTHIKLCLETFKKHLFNYKIIVLNNHSIKEYLPDVRDDLNDLLIAQKVDYYRIALLYRYGGIWIDADSIIMRNLDEVFDKLDNEYDFVGFGCTGNVCFNGKFRPSNWMLASRQNGLLMKTTLNLLDEKLNKKTKSYKYHDLGKLVIWEALDKLKLNGYDYYHYGAEYDGSRDVDGYWIETSRHFSTNDIKLINEDKLFLVFLTNSGICEQQPWVKTAKKEEILNGNFWISKYFRKSLNNF